MNVFRTATVTAAALGTALAASLTTAAAAPAPAPASPAFLAAKDMPASSTAWKAGKVKAGVTGDYCVKKALPKKSSSYRDFRTELETSATQTVAVTASTAKAKALVTKVRASLDSCLERLKKENPGLKGKEKYHGRIAVEEGVHVYSVDTHSPSVGSTDISLYSVGRDGRTVTVVDWGQLGDLDDAPLKGFKKTARTSVAKLY